MELQAVESTAIVGHCGYGRRSCAGEKLKTGGQFGDLVAVAHPHVQHRVAFVIDMVLDVLQQSTGLVDLHLGKAKFLQRGRNYLTAQLRGHGVQAVTDAQHRHIQLKYNRWGLRSVLGMHRFRAAGKDDAAGAKLADIGGLDIPGPDFAVDTDFTDAACDELGVLGPEVEDQDAIGMNVACHRPVINHTGV